MRALIVSDVCGKQGGAYLATFNLCRALHRLGHQVHCLAMHFDSKIDFGKEAFRTSRPIVKFGHRWKLPHHALVRQTQLVNRIWRPNLVISVGLTSLSTQILRILPKQSVYVWELTNATPGNKFVDPKIRAELSRCRAVLSPSMTIDKNIVKTYGYAGRIERLPFWIEPSTLGDSPASQRPPSQKTNDFIFLARRDPEKGLSELIQAAATVLKSHPQTRLLIAGAGDDTPYVAIADSLKIPSQNLRFVSFPNHSDALCELGRSKYLVLPSYHEGYPLSLLEAAEIGVPFIATDVGSIAEVFGDTQGCHIIPARDTNALTQAMACALETPVSDYTLHSDRLISKYKTLCSDKTIQDFLERLI
jgi:glycosyltransferase involved in cell wall biosynthesis